MLSEARQSLSMSNLIFTVGALLLAFAFEFVNGFHDTANAVATVIYTKSLRPTVAVVWSAIWNVWASWRRCRKPVRPAGV